MAAYQNVSGVQALTLDLDEVDGWIVLSTTLSQHPHHVVVINMAARNDRGIVAHGPLLTKALAKLNRPLVTLWVINRQRDSLELLEDYLKIMPDAQTHVVRNGHFGPTEKFELYNTSPHRQRIEGARRPVADLPDLADRVSDTCAWGGWPSPRRWMSNATMGLILAAASSWSVGASKPGSSSTPSCRWPDAHGGSTRRRNPRGDRLNAARINATPLSPILEVLMNAPTESVTRAADVPPGPAPGRAPFNRSWAACRTGAERARFDAIRNALRLRDDDAVWTLFVALEYYLNLYERFPAMIRGAARELLIECKNEATGISPTRNSRSNNGRTPPPPRWRKRRSRRTPRWKKLSSNPPAGSRSRPALPPAGPGCWAARWRWRWW